MLEWYARLGPRRAPGTALELAAGPAAHAIELARLGVATTALDLSAAMCAHARRRAAAAGVALEVVEADMASFSLGARRRFDLALNMCDSASHLLDLDAMVGHLRAVAGHLHRRGIYVLELAHPADFLAAGTRTRDRWRLRRDGRRIDVRWTTTAPLDPVTQHERAVLTVRVDNGRASKVFSEELVLRRWTQTEIEAAVRLAGGLDVVEWRGGFETASALADGWRMIAVVRGRG